MKKNNSNRVFVLLLVMLICAIVWIWWPSVGLDHSSIRFKSQMTVSAEQIKAIGRAIEAYEAKHKGRPERLSQLVDAGMLRPSQLHDQRRGRAKSIVDPDVLYFPAVTRKDPPHLVLLCALLLQEDKDKYQVITNDGDHREMDRHELIAALQRTYTHIGRVLREKELARRRKATAGGVSPIISHMADRSQASAKIEAKYKLPGGKVVLVLAENRTDARSHESIKRKFTNAMNAELVKRKLARKTISYDDLMEFRLRTPGYHQMAIKDICRQLKADLVIYVHIDKFVLRDDTSDVWRGQIGATVFVKDHDNRLWPEDLPKGHEVKPIERRASTDSSHNYGDRLTDLLAIQMADRIAKLFYDHQLPGIAE